MALTLAEAAKLSNNQLQRGVMEVISISTTLLDRLQFEEIVGNAYEYNMEGALPTTAFRAVNSGYSESTGTFVKATETLSILGGDADVDVFLEKTRSNINGQRATQETMKSKSLAANFCNTFVNGDTNSDANAFNGLKKRLTGSQVIDFATNGQGVVGNGAGDIDTFFDALDALLAACPGVDALYTNAAILSKFRGAARRKTVATTQVDGLGRTIDMYNGVPILDLGNKADGTPIIPQTETQGTSNIAGSIYAVHFGDALGDQGVIGLQNGIPQVRDLGELQTQPVYRTRIEWYPGLGAFGPKPAARLRGVLAA